MNFQFIAVFVSPPTVVLPLELRALAIAVAGLLLYHASVSWLLRRRKTPRVIVPQYSPPEGMSPGAIRYLLTGSADEKTLGLVLIDLASRGLISIRPQFQNFLITKRVGSLPSDLPDEERAAFDALFNGVVRYKSPITGVFLEQPAQPRDSFVWDPISGVGAAECSFAVQGSLRSQMERTFFTRNLKFVVPALVLSVFLVVWAVARAQASRMGEPVAPLLGMLIVTFHFVCAILLIGYLPRADDLFRRRVHATSDVKLLVGLLYAYLCFVAFLFAEISTGYYALLLISVVNVYLAPRLRTPTRLGRERLDQLEGFRQFLVAVDLDKFHRVMQPNWAPSLSATNLVYALAFDLEGVWADFLEVCSIKCVNIGNKKVAGGVLTREPARSKSNP